jgi:electron transfer flavoprotein beta subunit
MKVLMFNGSPKAKGCTYTALEEMAKVLNEEGIETEIMHVGAHPQGSCMGCGGCSKTGECVYGGEVVEAAKKLSAETKGSVTALSVGSSKALDATKIRKDILSRGANDLKLVISDDHSFSDSFETAKALAAAIREQEEVDLVLCGTGSSDLYNQVTGIQLGTLLDWPTLNNVTSIQPNGDTVLVERTLENSTEVFEVALPAVLSVSSEINVPTVPAMRDIMQAGKKPVAVLTTDLADLNASASTLEQLAPEQQERRQEIIEGDNEEAVDALVAFLKKEAL